MKPKILVIDDEKNTRDGLREALADDYDVLLASARERLTSAFSERNTSRRVPASAGSA